MNDDSVKQPTSNPAAVALVFIAYMAMGVYFFRFVSHYAVNIFITDQWDFHRATLFEPHSLWEIFRWQHGPHRQGLGGIISKLLDPYFAWSSRAQAFEAAVIVFAAAVVALVLKRRLFGRINAFDIALPLLFLNRGQYQSLIGATNIAHGPMPLLLLMLYCLAWTIPNQRSRYAVVLILNFCLIYTGFGVFIGVITPLLLGLEYAQIRRISPPRGTVSLHSLPLCYRRSRFLSDTALSLRWSASGPPHAIP